MHAKLCVAATEENLELSAQELALRLLRRFPSAVVDWERGNSSVQEQLERLISLNAPDVILESHRACFGNVALASVSETHWDGAIATSYLHRMWPPLGDSVFFHLENMANDTTAVAIANELADALGMVSCPEADVSELR